MTGEQIVAIVIAGVALIPLICICIVMLKGKGEFLIAGYNTMSKEKQSKINAKLLCRFIGLMLIFIIAFIIGFIVGAVLNIKLLMIISGSLFGVAVIFTLIFANTKKFKIQK